MGLETLFELYKDSARSRLHEVVICFHSVLLEQHMRCIGKSWEPSQQATAIKSSELLPSGWNEDANTVELFYINTVTKDVYKIVALTEAASCLLHLLSTRTGEDKAGYIEIDLNEYVNETTHKTIDQVYKNVDRLKQVITEKLINSVIPSPAVAEGGAVLETRSRDSKDVDRYPPGFPRGDREGPSGQFDPLRDYGRADVDPFYVEPGGIPPFPSGGMIFDPFRQVRPRAPDRFSGLIQPLPRGAVPPGARFDPFGPPGTGRPNPDIERKPDFNDDFYS